MQQAIPYKSWEPINPLLSHSSLLSSRGNDYDGDNNNNNNGGGGTGGGGFTNMVRENPVIVFAKKGCCMSHVVKRLLQGLGVNPCAYEVDDDDGGGDEGDEHDVEARVLEELKLINDGDDEMKKKVQFPAVFIGGKLFGGLDRIMATHITGELVPILKEAKALWL